MKTSILGAEIVRLCLLLIQGSTVLYAIISPSAKLVPLAYGIKKLQISCVVEDDKVQYKFCYSVRLFTRKFCSRLVLISWKRPLQLLKILCNLLTLLHSTKSEFMFGLLLLVYI